MKKVEVFYDRVTGVLRIMSPRGEAEFVNIFADNLEGVPQALGEGILDMLGASDMRNSKDNGDETY